MSCNCPNPELCAKIGKHINGRLWEIWTGEFSRNPLTEAQCEQYRQKWTDAADVDLGSIRHIGKQESEPTFAEKATNFAKAAATHVVQRLPQASESETHKRLTICKCCRYYCENNGNPKCKKCGCWLLKKIRWEDQRCPIKKWRSPLVTLGMACYDDPYGVYDTVTDLRLYHSEIMPLCEIVVVDNNPTGKYSQKIKRFCEGRTLARYIPFDGPSGTQQARNEVFRQAKGQYVVCMDSHVKFEPGVLKKLIEYFAANPTTTDLLQGPCLTEAGTFHGTEQRRKWAGGALGVWSVDNRGREPDNEPYEIWQQGMGVFACRKDAWVEFHKDMQGFGGCETYVAEKFRQRGDRVLCLPFFRWLHRFIRFEPPQDQRKPTDNLINYLIGFSDLNRPDLIEELMIYYASLATDEKHALTRNQYKRVIDEWTKNCKRPSRQPSNPENVSLPSGSLTAMVSG